MHQSIISSTSGISRFIYIYIYIYIYIFCIGQQQREFSCIICIDMLSWEWDLLEVSFTSGRGKREFVSG